MDRKNSIREDLRALSRGATTIGITDWPTTDAAREREVRAATPFFHQQRYIASALQAARRMQRA